MTVQPGNCTQRGEIALGQATKTLPPCAAKVVGLIATFATGCFLKIREIAELVFKNNGQPYHPKHIGRSIRMAAAKGHLEHRVLRTGQRAGDMKFRSAHGQGFNRVDFRRHFGMADPVNAATRKAMSRRDSEDVATARAQHGATGAMVEPASALPAADLAMFEHMAAGAVAAATARELIREQQQDAAMYESVKRVRAPP